MTRAYSSAEAELAFPASDRTGARRIQEWLCLHGAGVQIDGEIGPATREAIREFQVYRGIMGEKGCGKQTWAALVGPLERVVKPIEKLPSDTLAGVVGAYAIRHLGEHPREVGGPNMGPWVRLYMQGNQGKEWPWCAGFATFVVRQAALHVGVDPPVPVRFGCDELADIARKSGRFLEGGVRPSPGSLFLVPATNKGFWSHIGIVSSVDGAQTMKTVEGNTNDSGSPEGFEVCRRTRAIAGKGFIRI